MTLNTLIRNFSEQVTGSGNFGAEAKVFEIQSWTWSRAPVENSGLVVDLDVAATFNFNVA